MARKEIEDGKNDKSIRVKENIARTGETESRTSPLRTKTSLFQIRFLNFLRQGVVRSQPSCFCFLVNERQKSP
ncbi:hypothetical protein E2P81_ATG07006 [Venturia nashicola]|uniref:Uncharacterized protein n=1 Tax=Venturia nashicola TaxID=86259 RepID=A0A4Z1NF20_9PEZI|nr:hypothetical protein E6O75_ATG07171 [Venturia nashicola]TLD19389.1 hypothetical protein E2P81_ATG07006 [Venturia nashicola]